jgi:peptidoglycan hydrolase-like protein with peptidoglycan-binding domain
MPVRLLPTSLIVAVLSLTVAACSGSDAEQTATSTTAGSEAPDSESTATTRASIEAAGPNFVVSALQESLDVLGYDVGPIDGLVGPKSRQAVADFQSDSGLEPSGAVDGPTTLALAEASPEAAFFVVEAVQTQLAELGYFTGLIDGDFGDETRAALDAFHNDYGVDAGGEVSVDTLTKLTDVYISEVVIPTLESNGYVAPEPKGDTSGFLRQGDESPEVQELQETLIALGFRPGDADGRFGADTTSAVLAFQKHEGLDRDGIVGPGVLSALESPQGAGPQDSSGPRIEVDLDRQIAFIIDANGTVTTINISSGSGRTYDQPGGGTAVAYTPSGDFTIERSIDGIREAALGSLYRPHYFHEGWAIHGSPNVPAYPASHGCIRTSNYDQDFLFPIVAIDDPVVIYGTSLGDPGQGEAGF